MQSDLGTIILPPTMSGDGHKLHNRTVGGQGITYQCEKRNPEDSDDTCQYCKGEAREKADREKQSV